MPILYSRLKNFCLNALSNYKYKYFRWIDNEGTFLYATCHQANKNYNLENNQLAKDYHIYMGHKSIKKDGEYKGKFLAALQKSCKDGKYIKRLKSKDKENKQKDYKVRVYQFVNNNAEASRPCCSPSTIKLETDNRSDPDGASSSGYGSNVSPSIHEVEQFEPTPQHNSADRATEEKYVLLSQSAPQIYTEELSFAGNILLAKLTPLAMIQQPTKISISDDREKQPALTGYVQTPQSVDVLGNLPLINIENANILSENTTLSDKYMDSYSELPCTTQLPMKEIPKERLMRKSQSDIEASFTIKKNSITDGKAVDADMPNDNGFVPPDFQQWSTEFDMEDISINDVLLEEPVADMDKPVASIESSSPSHGINMTTDEIKDWLNSFLQ